MQLVFQEGNFILNQKMNPRPIAHYKVTTNYFPLKHSWQQLLRQRGWVLTLPLQERDFKLLQYLNLDGVMVCTIV